MWFTVNRHCVCKSTGTRTHTHTQKLTRPHTQTHPFRPFFSLAADFTVRWSRASRRALDHSSPGKKNCTFIVAATIWPLGWSDGEMASRERASTKIDHVFRGTFIHSTQDTALQILEDALLGVDSAGKVWQDLLTYTLYSCAAFAAFISTNAASVSETAEKCDVIWHPLSGKHCCENCDYTAHKRVLLLVRNWHICSYQVADEFSKWKIGCLTSNFN